MRGNGRLIRLGFAACRGGRDRRGGDDFVGGVADFADNHQIFCLCPDADADVELVFHRVKFGVVAAPIDIKFGIVGAFFQQAGEYAAVIAPLRYGDADDAAYLVFSLAAENRFSLSARSCWARGRKAAPNSVRWILRVLRVKAVRRGVVPIRQSRALPLAAKRTGAARFRGIAGSRRRSRSILGR